MSVRVETPYVNGATLWLRGNLHTHSTNSDGLQSPQRVIDAYAARNYDFLMISDHDTLTDPASVKARGMILIPGVEITAGGPHILHVNAPSVVDPDPDRQNVLDTIQALGGFAVMNHPNWGADFAHCPQALLHLLQGYTGVEIYNGVVRRDAGSPEATDRWDQLLASGRRVWGFANDDCHEESDEQVAWMMVHSEDRRMDSLLAAFQAGRFYCTTGVQISRIAVEGEEIVIETENAQKFVVIGDAGRRLAEASGNAMTFHTGVAQGCSYVRIEAHGYGEAAAWTQPFFLRAP